MFTGIVEGQGRIEAIQAVDGGVKLTIASDFDLDDCPLGASIAVDGCCLTVTHREDRTWTADVSRESLDKTTLGDRVAGSRVNLERPVRVGDRLGGHIVTGHVDGTGRVRSKTPAGEATDWLFDASEILLDEIVVKGSVTIDGISLTVNVVDEHGFGVTIIPHTAQVTTLGTRQLGDRVNLETDIVGKYIVSLARRGRIPNPQLPNTQMPNTQIIEKDLQI
ncbi:MAG: riboflavin synthase [Myxococcota bacterium]